MANNPRVARAEQYVRDRVRVSRSDIAAAKAFILRQTSAPVQKARELMADWQETLGCAVDDGTEIVLDLEGSELARLDLVVRGNNARLAFAHAINELVQAGVFAELDGERQRTRLSLRLKFASSGQASTHALQIEELCATYPSAVVRATWLDHDTLGDPDLYLGLVDISGVDPGIADALRDAVKCFRNGLLTPCIAMLFSAVEGAWIELGQRQGGKVKDAMTNPQTSITAKVKKVVTALKNGALDKTWIAELEDTLEWTDMLRRSRNAIHHGAVPPTPNNYDKVAMLMLSTPRHLRLLAEVDRHLP